MLTFKYGVMGSGKTIECITKIYHERSKGNKVLVIKPKLDTRSEYIESRAGLRVEIDYDETFLLRSREITKIQEYDFIIVDEAQFLEDYYINLLRLYANDGIKVICYGLKTDFKTKLFTGTQRLIEIANNIIEIESSCKYCNNKAIFNMRLNNGVPIFKGEAIKTGGDESYVAVCSKCYYDAIWNV